MKEKRGRHFTISERDKQIFRDVVSGKTYGSVMKSRQHAQQIFSKVARFLNEHFVDGKSRLSRISVSAIRGNPDVWLDAIDKVKTGNQEWLRKDDE